MNGFKLAKKSLLVNLIEAIRRKPGATASQSLRTWAINPCPTLYTSRPIKRCTSVTAIYNLQKTGAIFVRTRFMLNLKLKLERGFVRSFQHTQIVFSVIYGSSIFIFPRRVCVQLKAHSHAYGRNISASGEQQLLFTCQLMDRELIIQKKKINS